MCLVAPPDKIFYTLSFEPKTISEKTIMDIQALYRHHHRILQTKITQKTVLGSFLEYGDLYGKFKLHYAIFVPVHNP